MTIQQEANTKREASSHLLLGDSSLTWMGKNMASTYFWYSALEMITDGLLGWKGGHSGRHVVQITHVIITMKYPRHIGSNFYVQIYCLLVQFSIPMSTPGVMTVGDQQNWVNQHNPLTPGENNFDLCHWCQSAGIAIHLRVADNEAKFLSGGLFRGEGVRQKMEKIPGLGDWDEGVVTAYLPCQIACCIEFIEH